MIEKNFYINRMRDFKKELSLSHPLYLQFYFLINDIKKYLNNIPMNSTIVDLGCGTKPYQQFIDVSIKYIGVDVDSANNNVDIVSSVYKVDLPSESADYIVSFQVLEHLEEPYLMLQEAHRLLRTAGEICLTFPMSEHIHEEPYDYFRYTEYGIEYLLKKSGFESIRVIKQGTNFANIGRRLAQLISGRRYLKILIPLINYIFVRLERRNGLDVMNYMVTAKKEHK